MVRPNPGGIAELSPCPRPEAQERLFPTAVFGRQQVGECDRGPGHIAGAGHIPEARLETLLEEVLTQHPALEPRAVADQEKLAGRWMAQELFQELAPLLPLLRDRRLLRGNSPEDPVEHRVV